MAIKINVANFKGGVGKTTTSVLMSYLLQNEDYKVLFVDFDPQANGTKALTRTFGKEDQVEQTIFEAIQNENLKECLVEVTPNLHLLPSALDLVAFPNHMFKMNGDDSKRNSYYLDYLLMPLEDDYDFIFIDVPPTISEFTNNAVVSSDYILIVMQTHMEAFEAAEDMFDYVKDCKESFGSDAEIIGVLPVLLSKRDSGDKWVMEQAKESFGDLIFKNVVEIQARIARFHITGITNEDHHDKRALRLYKSVLDELFERIDTDKGVVVTNGQA